MLRGLRVLLLTVGAAGCNAILGLEPTELATYDAWPDAGPCLPSSQHDEDQDGTVDECDRCPHVADDQTDTDRDHVGDACDPGDAVHRLVVVDTFESDAAAWTNARGSWAYATDTYAQSDAVAPSTLAVRSVALPAAAAIDATFVIGTTTPATDASAGLWFYGAIDIGEPSGYLCHVVRTADDKVEVRLSRWTGDTPTLLAYATYDVVFDSGEAFRLRAERSAGDTLSCTALQGGFDFGVEAVDGTYQNGTIALRTSVMSAAVQHVVVIGADDGN